MCGHKGPIFFKLKYEDRYLWTLHFTTSMDDLDLNSRSQLYGKSKTTVSISSQISELIWLKFSMFQQPVGFFKLFVRFVLCDSYSKGRSLLRWFIKYTFNIGMHWDTCEPICFKLNIMLDMMKLQNDYSFNNLGLHPRSQGWWKELVHSFSCKVTWSNPRKTGSFCGAEYHFVTYCKSFYCAF